MEGRFIEVQCIGDEDRASISEASGVELCGKGRLEGVGLMTEGGRR